MFNRFEFEETMDMHNNDIDVLIEDLEKLNLRVVQGETSCDPKNCIPETPLSVYLVEIVDGYIDDNKAYVPVYETTPVCELLISLGKVERCKLSSEFADTDSSLKFKLLSKLYERLYNGY